MKRVEVQWTVQCLFPECSWTYSNFVKSDVEQQTKYHRSTHERALAPRASMTTQPPISPKSERL